jgi:hypothetical protein
MWNTVLLDATQCTVVNKYRSFGGAYYLHVPGRENGVNVNSFKTLIDFYDDLLMHAQSCGPQKGYIF